MEGTQPESKYIITDAKEDQGGKSKPAERQKFVNESEE